MVTNIIRICEGFLNIDPSQSLAYFETVSETTFIVKSVLYNTQTLILDAVVVSHYHISDVQDSANLMTVTDLPHVGGLAK